MIPKDGFIKACEDRDRPYIFVSYSHDDAEAVQGLLREMERNRYRFWYDDGLKSGREWADEVGWRVTNCAQFLLIMTPSASRSVNVNDEISLAKEHRRNFCILYLEPTELSPGLSLQIGRYFAIHRSKFTAEEFRRRFLGELEPTARITETRTVGRALAELQEHYLPGKAICRGGTSEIFLATARRTGLPVAVKHAALDSTFMGQTIRGVLESEKNVLRTLAGCDGVPMLIDWFQDEANIYLVEQFCGETNLDQVDTEYGAEEILQLAAMLLKTLTRFEQQNVLYLDMKPSNLTVHDSDTLFIVDYGSACIGAMPEYRFGTPGFAAPEQFSSKKDALGAYTDIYGVGRTLLYLLLRRHLSRTAFESFSAQTHSLRYFRPELPPELEAILETMTAEQPGDRFQSAEEALAVLEACPAEPREARGILFWRSERRRQQYQRYLQKKGAKTLPYGQINRDDVTEILDEYDYQQRHAEASVLLTPPKGPDTEPVRPAGRQENEQSPDTMTITELLFGPSNPTEAQ